RRRVGGGPASRVRGRLPDSLRRLDAAARHRRTDSAGGSMTDRKAGAAGGPLVGVLVGAPPHEQVMQQAGAILERFDIAYELQVMSSHRNPDLVDEYARTAEERGIVAII